MTKFDRNLKDSYRRKTEGTEARAKTKTDDAGLDVGGRLWRAERRGHVVH